MIVERLGQEGDRPLFHHIGHDLQVAVAGDNHNGQRIFHRQKPILKPLS